MNVVMTGDGRFVEVQGTAEGDAVRPRLLDPLLDLGPRVARTSPASSRRPSRVRAVTAQVFLASRNAKKLEEMQRILGPTSGHRGPGPRRRPGVRRACRDRADLPRQRQDQGARRGPCHRPAILADDSGLCVDALNGMPGVLSARWAGSSTRTDRPRTRQQRAAARPARGRPRRASDRALHLCGRAGPPAGRPGRRERRRGHHGRAGDPRARGTGGFGYDVLFCADELRTSHRRAPSCGRRPRSGMRFLPGRFSAATTREWCRAVLPGRQLVLVGQFSRDSASLVTSWDSGASTRWMLRGRGAMQNVGELAGAGFVGAPGETRTHTGTDLNRVPLPLGYGRAGPV